MAIAKEQDFHPNDAELTRMRRRHVRAVMRIENLVYPRPWSSTLFYQEIANRPDRVYLIARLEGEVIGYAGIMTSGYESHVTTIAVDPEYQGRRLGMKLMIGLFDAAIENGGRTMSLEVRMTNAVAQTMYTRFGFKPVGIRRGYYVESGEDAIVMLCEQIDTVEFAQRLDDLREVVAGPLRS
ncbi:MAG TPA: ribosomal protein S18-alanine N-acetyltransferase [Actinomycetota bacterium]|nr:ribosomal protein S18-alanine N-acetyltransferase [Actinomycetota bacterium]